MWGVLKSSLPRSLHVQVRLYRPPVRLARYISTFYTVECEAPDGESVSDYRYPQWGNFLFHSGRGLSFENHAGVALRDADFIVTGPNLRALRFELGTGRIWGVALMPLGWAKFVPAPAVDFADALIDGGQHPDFVDFSPLADVLFGARSNPDAEFARISDYFLARVDGSVPDDSRITAIHTALFDAEVGTVTALAERARVSHRTVERVCNHAFGFSPKLLLRRQRFMRSLGEYMRHPTRNWIAALDDQYHDQAQFVREFREFMGMTPREYARIGHPVIDAFIAERSRLAWTTMQALDGPCGAGAATS
jgi:AraC-like DNA-binding protein